MFGFDSKTITYSNLQVKFHDGDKNKCIKIQCEQIVAWVFVGLKGHVL